MRTKPRSKQICLACKANNKAHPLLNKKGIRSWKIQIDGSWRLDGDPIGKLNWGIDLKLVFVGFLYCQLKYINKKLFFYI